MRDKILESILKDMPEPINYHEQIQKIVWDDSFSQLPIELQNAITSNGDVKNYLEIKSTRIADCGCIYLRAYNHYVQSKETIDKITALHILNDAQDDKRREIRSNLLAVIYTCSTAKQFSDNFPEFAAYLPKEDQPIRNLPAVDLINTMKNSGWTPKQSNLKEH